MHTTTPSTPVLTSLTAQDFLARVQAVAPRVAVFDCDGTLWSGDAGSAFMEWSIATGLLSAQRTAWLNERYEGYKRGDVSELAICGEMVQVYAGIPEIRFRAAAAEFFRSHVEAKIFPVLRELIAWLQRDGVELWAVSSTNQWVIEEGVQRFGIPADHVLAARVAVKEAILTDSLLDVPTDEGKVAALQAAGVHAPDAVFGNSIHDAAMLAFGRVAFPVNPTKALADLSARNGWPVFQPSSTLLGLTGKHQEGHAPANP